MAKRLEEDLLMAHTAMASPDEVVQQPQDKELEPQLQAMIEAYVEGGDKAPLVLPSMGVELRRYEHCPPMDLATKSRSHSLAAGSCLA